MVCPSISKVIRHLRIDQIGKNKYIYSHWHQFIWIHTKRKKSIDSKGSFDHHCLRPISSIHKECDEVPMMSLCLSQRVWVFVIKDVKVYLCSITQRQYDCRTIVFLVSVYRHNRKLHNYLNTKDFTSGEEILHSTKI